MTSPSRARCWAWSSMALAGAAGQSVGSSARWAWHRIPRALSVSLGIPRVPLRYGVQYIWEVWLGLEGDQSCAQQPGSPHPYQHLHLKSATKQRWVGGGAAYTRGSNHVTWFNQAGSSIHIASSEFNSCLRAQQREGSPHHVGEAPKGPTLPPTGPFLAQVLVPRLKLVVALEALEGG